MSDDVLETEDAWTEYGLTKIWVKLAHAYTADTRLSSSSPPHALLESLRTRLTFAVLGHCSQLCTTSVKEGWGTIKEGWGTLPTKPILIDVVKRMC